MSLIDIHFVDEERTLLSDVEQGAFFTPKSGQQAGRLFIKLDNGDAWDVEGKRSISYLRGNLTSQSQKNPPCRVYPNVSIELSS